jgi:NADPH2:quinone reductase
VIGNRGTTEINPRDAMSRETDIRGVTIGSASEPEYKAMHAALLAALQAGTLKPVIGQKFPLAQAAQAHEAVMQHSGARGKIVLLP